MTNCKLVVSDIDGTLLDSHSRLRPDTREAIERLRAAGILFTLSTGRPMLGARPYAFLASPEAPLIVENGGALVLPGSEERVFRRLLGREAAVQAIRLGEREGVHVAVWLDDMLYYNHRDFYSEKYYDLLDRREPLPITDPFTQFPEGVDKVVWLGEAERIGALDAALQTQPIPGARATMSMPILLEFMHEDISKGATLRRLADYLGIPLSQTAALGDGFNDLEMLQTAGLGIAMGNAPEAVRLGADRVAPPNDEGGFAAALDALLRG